MQIKLTRSLFLALLAAESVSPDFRKICEQMADFIDPEHDFLQRVKEAGKMVLVNKIEAVKFIRSVASSTPGFTQWVLKEYPRPNGYENSGGTGLGLAYAKGLAEYAAEFLV